MSYETIEAAALTVLQLLANYTSTNSSVGDYRILGKGVTRAVILTPGSVSGRDVVMAPRVIQTTWTIFLDLYIPYSAAGELSSIRNKIRDDRQEVIDQFDAYPTLNSTSGIIHAIIVGANEPQSWQGESRNWWSQRMILQVIEHASITIAE